MFKCDPKGPLMIQIAKLYPNDNAQKFFALGRVFSGTIKLGERVKVLGETFSEDNDEDQATEDVIGVYTFNSRFAL
jgi:U5 small nuclear ribonucleoprotein component